MYMYMIYPPLSLLFASHHATPRTPLHCAIVLYIPEYKSFTANCVNNIPGLNGTFLSERMNQFAYNFASSEGNRALTQNIHSYNGRMTASCTSQYSDSLDAFNDLLQQMTRNNFTVQVS